jgi:tetratricopeptide (TPR) repeat protein
MPSPDADYGEAFRCLASVQAAMLREGATKELVLRRCHARFALGNYLAAAFDAERASRLDPECSEADYLKGQAFLALAAMKEGLVGPGIGAHIPSAVLPRRHHLLLTARKCFLRVLAANPDDVQAQRELRATDALLEHLAARTHDPCAHGLPGGAHGGPHPEGVSA